MAKGTSTVPKYTIRVALMWLIPAISAWSGGAVLVPALLAGVLVPIELPKVRQRIFGAKLRKSLPCLRAPALLRLAVLWMLQVWWLLLWRAAGPEVAASASEIDGAAAAASTAAVGGDATWSWRPRSLSIVLPCASEGEYAFKTVRAVFEATPSDLLREIIVVDDGSSPSLEETHLTVDVQRQYRVQVIRHETTLGLIDAKKDGGDAATGDIVVFFDCHVAPQQGWHNSFISLIAENYRRIVVPVITDLDVGTWRQRGGSQGNAKCYLTWDADFKWFESDDPYVPVVSGGLLGISKRWWNETGGYDDEMRGWGGENLDQSLRSWLCGGEIMVAKDSFVAHMWRVHTDKRTTARYRLPPNAATVNRLRASVSWFGDFAEKLAQFPALESNRLDEHGDPWYGDIENILAVKQRLHCRSFAWFLRRFKHVYEDGGLVPRETFGLRAEGDLCLTYLGVAGTSPTGKGRAALRPCEPSNDRQRWHGANRDQTVEGKPCCSGLRAWNTDQCLAAGAVLGGIAETFVCDISGRDGAQLWHFKDEGELIRMRHGVLGFMQGQQCLQAKPGGSGELEIERCSHSWTKDRPEEPLESRLYREAIEQGRA